jgi:translation initiation factor IF-2
VNKSDLPSANPDRVKQQLSDLDLMPEEWGGNTLFVEVSALKHEGIEKLLESILLQSEILELRADYDVKAEGTIIESRIDPGRGTVASVLVQRGTLEVGDNFVSGIYPGRVRAMFNDRGEKVDRAEPSAPVEILGLTGVPNAGDPFQVTESEKMARQVGDKRQELRKVEDAKNVRKITLDNLYDSIQEGEVQELKTVIKGDVHGSVEAVQTALEKLSTPAIRLSVIHAAAGAINESDVMLASASNAIIVGFHVRPTPRAAELAEQEKVEIRKYNVIYDAVDDIRSAMEGLLAPSYEEQTIGMVEVREVFKVPKIGLIAGAYVTSGVVRRNAQVHIIRDGVQIYTGKISSLKRFKNDAREVEAGYECGVGVENYNDVKVGDQLEVFELKEVAKTLEESRQPQSSSS